MTRDEATKMLGLLPNEVGSAQSIRSAFAQIARKNHPDTGGSGLDADRLKLARGLLLSYIAVNNIEQEKACGTCGGLGMFRVGGGFRWRTCGACDGTGEKR